jgi:hypothetical protein
VGREQPRCTTNSVERRTRYGRAGLRDAGVNLGIPSRSASPTGFHSG